MSGNFKRVNREIPSVSQLTFDWERSTNVPDGTADMHADGKSDEPVLPATSANNDAAEASAESSEERGSAERNAEQIASHRTLSREKRESRSLLGVREAARKDSRLKFTALLHHVNEDCLIEAFFNLKKTAAVGITKSGTPTDYGTNQGRTNQGHQQIRDTHRLPRVGKGLQLRNWVAGTGGAWQTRRAGLSTRRLLLIPQRSGG
jgi:RNA-directed DNA polymerase